MPVPSSIDDLDTNEANNSPPGSESAKGNVDNYIRAAFAFIKQNRNFMTALLGTDSSNKAAARTTLGVPALSELDQGNLLINSNFSENKRAVAGTVTLAAGAYGHDRWKAGASGCTYTFESSGGVTTLTITAGSLIQVIEGEQLQTGTHVLCWTGTAQGKIGSGSLSATGVTGSVTGGANLNIEFGTGTLSQPHFRRGSAVLSWSPYRGIYGGEKQACNRYTQKGPFSVRDITLSWPIYMRAVPTVTGGGAGFSSGSSTADFLVASQTTSGLQTLTLVAEL